MIPLFVTNALDDKPLPMYASTQNKREWLHVRDHCRAIELVLAADKVGETYNVGSGIEASIEEIADLVLEHTGKPDSLKTIVPDRPGHDRRYLLDSSKLRRELGWEPRSASRTASARPSSGTPLKPHLALSTPARSETSSSSRAMTHPFPTSASRWPCSNPGRPADTTGRPTRRTSSCSPASACC